MNSGSKGVPGVMKCPTYCTDSTPFEECRCSCPDYDQLSNDELNTTMIKKVLSDMGVISWDPNEINQDRPDCNHALTSHYLYKKVTWVLGLYPPPRRPFPPALITS